MRYSHAWVFAVAAVLVTACGGNTTTAPSSTALDTANGKLSASSVSDSNGGRFTSLNSDPCGDVTYVGPMRPISVHGTTFFLSWLGSDNPVRGYEVQWELDVANVYTPAGSTIVQLPEAKIYVVTEGTYRFRVRGLFCNDQAGPWTDWQVKGTDDTEDHSPVTPPVICVTSVLGCYPPPPPPGCGEDCPPPPCVIDCPPPPCTEHCDGGDGDDDHGGGHGGDGGGDHNPPPFVDVTFCHVEVHHHHNSDDTYTGQTKTAHNQHELDAHFPGHPLDYLGACNDN